MEFVENMKVTQQKGRRIPLQIQEAIEKEIKNLLLEGHIEKVKDIKDDVFIQPTVVTVKKDHSVKVALDARELNKNVKKDKYQMPNLENLIDIVAERLDVAEGIAWFTTLDLNYAYGQLALDESLSKHCNFQIVGGRCNRYLQIQDWVLRPHDHADRISASDGQ